LRIHLFGHLSVENNGEKIDRFPTNRSKVLLAFLAYHRGMHPRSLLAEMLWPGANPDAIRFRLNQTVAEIRKTLRPLGEAIQSDRFSLGLSSDIETDVAEFVSLTELERSEDSTEERLVRAIYIAREPLLQGLYEDWVAAAADDLNAHLASALYSLSHIAMVDQRWSGAVAYARRAAAINPYSEPIQQTLLHALVQDGRRAEAIRAYEEYEALLRDDFAIVPQSATFEIVRGIQAPSLAASQEPVRAEERWTSPIGGSIEEALEAYIRANDAERAMRLAGSLLQYWNVRGELQVGRRWLQRIFKMPQAVMAPPDARCIALIAFGFASISARKFSSADEAIKRALELARSMNHHKFIGDAMRAQGQAALRQGAFEVSKNAFEASLTAAEQIDDVSGLADSWNGVGECLRFMGRFGEAIVAHRQCRDLRIQIGRLDRAGDAVLNLGIVSSRMGRYDEALSMIREALTTLRTTGSPSVIADCVMEIAGAYAYTGRPMPAARLLSAVAKLRSSVSAPLSSSDRPDYVRFLSTARDQLSRDEFTAQWRLGQATSLPEMIDIALGS